MGTPESNLISSAKKGFKKNRIRMTRLEVISEIGVPDAFYSMEDLPGGGFIEFKRLREWPKRPTTPVKIKHFSQEQRAWMMLNGPWIERVFLHLQIGRDHMLFPWCVTDEVGYLVKDNNDNDVEATSTGVTWSK